MDLVKAFELPVVFGYLDSLQSRADAMVFSKEASHRGTSAAGLQKAFGVQELSHGAVDAILKEIHKNYLGLARSFLTLE